MLPELNFFKEVVILDLNEIGSKCILSMIDSLIRLVQNKVIKIRNQIDHKGHKGLWEHVFWNSECWFLHI